VNSAPFRNSKTFFNALVESCQIHDTGGDVQFRALPVRRVNLCIIIIVALCWLSVFATTARAQTEPPADGICSTVLTDEMTFDAPPPLKSDGSHTLTPQSVALIGCRWNKLDLTVSFWSGSAEQHAIVRNVVRDWEAVSGIKFIFVGNNDTEADIRVAFYPPAAGEGGYTTFVGTCGHQRRDGAGFRPAITYNMNLSSLNRGIILHEFGHALGLVHEHQNPEGGIKWNEAVVRAEMRAAGWTDESIDANILRRYDRSETKFTEFDRWSVMIYTIPNRWTLDDFEIAYRLSYLSELDKAFISNWYPPRTGWGGGHTPQDRLADMNGDGRTDVIQLYGGNSYVWLSTGTGFQPFTRWGSGHTEQDKLGDFNGDGKMDVIQFYEGKSYVWLSTGTTFQSYTQWGSGHTALDSVGDFNGDGRTDVVQFFGGK